MGVYDVWTTYEALNKELLADGYTGELFSEDRNVEQLGLIVGVRKWEWEGCEGHPYWPETLGLEFVEHHAISAKYDVFIYARC